jgi:hypothetical protein
MVSGPVNVVVTVPCVLFCRQNAIPTRQSFCVSCRSQNVCVDLWYHSETLPPGLVVALLVHHTHTRQPHVVLLSELTCIFLHTVISFLRVHLSTAVPQGLAATQNECGICCYLWTPHEGTGSQNSVFPRHGPLSYSSFVGFLLRTTDCCASLETPPTWHQLRLIFLKHTFCV